MPSRAAQKKKNMRFNSEKMIGFTETGVARRLVFLAAIAAMSAPFTFASLDSCITPSSTSASGRTDTTSGVPIAANPGSGADDFASLSTSPVTGCSGTDINFQNFTQTGVSSGNGGSGGVYVSLLSNSDLSAGAVDAVFSTIRGSDGSSGGSSTYGNGGTNDDRNNWTGGSSGDTYVVDYTANATGGAYFQYVTIDLNGLNIGAAGYDGSAGSFAGTISLCLGGTWSSGGTGGTCSAGNGNIDTITYVAGTNTYNVALSTTYTTIGIENSFTLTNGSGYQGGTTWLTSFDEDFAESPEPGSFLLLGAGLAGLAFVRLRKHRV